MDSAESATNHESAAPWSLLRRIWFRFVCGYFLLYSLPSNDRDSIFSSIPGSQFLWKPYLDLWRTLCPWVGKHWFHLSGRAITYTPTGSGDTTLDYIENLLFVVLALLATLVWSLLDRHRRAYNTLEAWLRLLVRYALAFTLFDYGFAKVVPFQFRAPGFSKLIEPYGDFSPMGVLWSFMGASTAYIIFAGAAELLPGLLLLFRRTTTLGALAAFAVLLNVMALNYCYDVPVKLYSTNLVLMALYLVSTDLRRLIDIFLLNRATVPADYTVPRFSRRWARISAIVFQVVFVGFTLGRSLWRGWQAYQIIYVHPQRPPIYGLYDVEKFTRNGKDVPLLETDATRWRKVIAEYPGFLTVRLMNETTRDYPAVYNDDRKTLTLTDPNDRRNSYNFTYSRSGPNYLNLEGTLAGDHVSMLLVKVDRSKFLLVNRGFHWINEVPYNR
jgi:uncharacterized membrane protein YphA (DoxX/SURF4 family)